MYYRTNKIFFLIFLSTVLLLPQLFLQAQTQLWYQKSGGNVGAAMNVTINQQGMIFTSVYNQGIYRSLDTGTTWQQIAPYTDGVWTMAIRSTGEIVASLWSRGIFRSTDNGNSWTELVSTKLNSDVRAINSLNEIFIESAGKLFYSSANDTSWIELPISGGAISVSNNTMFAAKGTIVHRSTNNGKQWTQLSNVSAPIYSLVSETTGKIFVGTYYDNAVSSSSIFAYNTLSGIWTENGPATTINAMIRRHDGVLFAASHDSGFYFSTNQGEEWKQYNIGLSSKKIYSLALLNDTTVVAGTLDGIFFSSGPLSSLLPVELVSFTAVAKSSHVELFWRTATEINNYGFEIQRVMMNDKVETRNWSSIGFVEGSGTSNAPKEYHFFDRVSFSGIYQYRLKQIDRDGKFHYSQTVEVIVKATPQKFSLEQNYPNPFNPSTVINYQLPVTNYVTLKVYDAIGREVATLVNEMQEAGSYAIPFLASHLTSSVYFYTLQFQNSSITRKMLLLR